MANGGFDAGLAGWTDAGELVLRPGGGVASPSLEVRAGAASQIVPAAPGTGYVLRALYRASAGGGTVLLALQYLNASNQALGQDSVALAAAADWTRAEVSGTSPAGTAAIRVRLIAGGSRVLTVDDVVVVPD